MAGPPAKRKKQSRAPGQRQAEQLALAKASALAAETLALLEATAERCERFKGVRMLGFGGGAAGCTALVPQEASGHGEAGEIGVAASAQGATRVRVPVWLQQQHSCELRVALAAFAIRFNNNVAAWCTSAIDELATALPATAGDRGHRARVANVVLLWSRELAAASTPWLAGTPKKQPFAPSAKLFKRLTGVVLAHGLMQGSRGGSAVELALAAWHLWTQRGSQVPSAAVDLPRSVRIGNLRWPPWIALLAPEARAEHVATLARTPMSAASAVALRRAVETHGPHEGVAQWIEVAAQRPALAQVMLRGLALEGVPDVREEFMLSVLAAAGTRVSWDQKRFYADYRLRVRTLECQDVERALVMVVRLGPAATSLTTGVE